MAPSLFDSSSVFASPVFEPLRNSPTLRAVGEFASSIDPRRLPADRPTEALALGYQTLRTGLFMAESVPLFWLQQPGKTPSRKKSKEKAMPPPPKEALEHTFARLQALIAEDARLVGEDLLPLRALAPRGAMRHGERLLRILADASQVAQRRQKRESKDFGRQARQWLDDLPKYYTRNFHYQTDGYLSAESADLYEHQVEILFRGGADAMRRLIIRPMKEAFGHSDGQGLHFLELGTGTGIGTLFVSMAFPKAKITCLDLSYPYLKHAQKQLRGRDRLDFVQGDAAELDFQENRFDGVFSVFLFHELPMPIREAVVEESKRVLKPGGFLGLVDSLQKGDDPALDWALDIFPREFHEPYYAHYAANPMEDILAEAGLEGVTSGTGYLAKYACARVPPARRTTRNRSGSRSAAASKPASKPKAKKKRTAGGRAKTQRSRAAK